MIHPLKTEKNLSQEDSRKDTTMSALDDFKARFDGMIAVIDRAHARAEAGSEKADLDEIAAFLTVLADSPRGRLEGMTLDGLQITRHWTQDPLQISLGADVTIIDLWDTLQIDNPPPF